MTQMRLEIETIQCARAVRDGGIDAIAALDTSLAEVIGDLSPENAKALKSTFGRLMGSIVDALINPAVASFPELAPDTTTWAAIAKSRAASRANSGEI